MSSGRQPGDFWPRCDGFVPGGAASDQEDDVPSQGLDFLLATPPQDDDGDGEAPMKRPSSKATRKPAAASKAVKPKGKALAKPKPKTKTTKPETTTKAKKLKAPKDEPTKTTKKKKATEDGMDEIAEDKKKKIMKAPPDKTKGCSKCRWAGCRTCGWRGVPGREVKEGAKDEDDEGDKEKPHETE